VENAEDSDHFMKGKNGDKLVMSFQCDLCHFHNLMKQDLLMTLAQVLWALRLTRRANLDALWSQEPSTVASMLTTCQHGSSIAKYLGFGDQLFPSMGHPLNRIHLG
jgi:hypothetical protein